MQRWRAAFVAGMVCQWGPADTGIRFGHRPTPVNTAVPLPFMLNPPKAPFGPIPPF